MTLSQSYAALGAAKPPDDAVVVSIYRSGEHVLGEVERPLAIIQGSVSLPAHNGPMAMPDALKQAEAMVEALKPYRAYSIVVRLEDDDVWREEWGRLER